LKDSARAEPVLGAERENNLETFFNPKSVAIVGASATPRKLGTLVLQNMRLQGFAGDLYPVNPKLTHIGALKCYPRISELPSIPELSVILIPAASVVEALGEHASKGIKNVIVMSAGFKEMGEKGERLQEELQSVAKKNHISIVGPNCLGIYDNISRLDTFFIPRSLIQRPHYGGVSLASQSGSFVAHLMDLASFERLGISRVINYGNKVDINENDALIYFADDTKTRVVGIYLEGVTDGREFLASAEYCSRRKPVVVLKTGKHESIASALTSHTGTLAGSYSSYEAAFKKSGVIEVRTEIEFIDTCKAIVSLPRAKGNRVLIVGHAGGLGLTVADLCISEGLQIPETGRDLEESLKEGTLPYAAVKNPIDLTASGSDGSAEFVFDRALVDGDFADIGIYLALWGLPQSSERIGEILSGVIKKSGKPVVVATLEGKKCVDKRSVFESKGIPVFFSLERAVRVARHLTELRDYELVSSAQKN
jgi:acetate---CoA ligase (ADP-forming) subunit alpha